MNRRTARYAVTVSILLAVTAPTVTACGGRPHPTPARPPATHATAATSPATPADDGDDGAQPETSTTPDPAALDVIAAFATAWARPDLSQQQWYAGVARTAAPAFAARLASVDPSRVPATRITGAPTVTAATASSVVADVGTDAGPITVTCARYEGRWLVVDVQPPERSPTATP
ncbi:hypothetical protein [Dactylosporangium darangshiense]|uniref:Lipoprotein n=1 Tax=Dactylosporangium darangshiense TaxID=579108 RepID=A0ABP8DMM3_9ACTN